MRILFYITGISPTIGGIEKFLLNFYDAQSDNIHMEILTRFYDSDTLMSQLFAEKNIKIHSLDIQHLNRKTIRNFHKKINIFFKEHRDEFDIFHTNCVVDPFIVRTAKKHGIKKIYTHIHSYIDFSMNFSGIIKKIALYDNSFFATACFGCSKEVGDTMYPFWGKKKFFVINNGINAQKFRYSNVIREKYRRKYKVEDDFVVCTVSRMDPVKNQLFLLEIFKKIIEKNKNSKLIVVGDGTERAKLIKKCEELKLQNDVRFLGEQSNVNEILQACDAFILTSTHEGFGMAAIEAQAAGLKTFVSENVIPKTIDCTGMVDFISLSYSSEVWADEILNKALSYDRQDKYENLCQSGFDYLISSRQLIDIYENKKDE